jgi:hypothetical protein
VSEKLVSFAEPTFGDAGSVGRLRIAIAYFAGGLADDSEATMSSPLAIGDIRERARENLLRTVTETRRARELHNECADTGICARNFANDRQGYRAVKTRLV